MALRVNICDVVVLINYHHKKMKLSKYFYIY